MPTAKCSINGCHREFEHPTQKSADHAALVHAARSHKGHNFFAGALKMDQGRAGAVSPTLEPAKAPKVDRRLKAWRHANPDKAKPIGQRSKANGVKKTSKPKAMAPVAQAVNFCPCCGCNIKKVAMGMVIAERL